MANETDTEFAGLRHQCDDPECHVNGFVATLARTLPEGCRCGHGPEAHDNEADPPLCLIHGDNTHCDYADDEEIAADRWDEGWHAAVIALVPPTLGESGRLLFVLDHMPEGNPYREGLARAENYRDKMTAALRLSEPDAAKIAAALDPEARP